MNVADLNTQLTAECERHHSEVARILAEFTGTAVHVSTWQEQLKDRRHPSQPSLGVIHSNRGNENTT
jgi:hypothetical protein